MRGASSFGRFRDGYPHSYIRSISPSGKFPVRTRFSPGKTARLGDGRVDSRRRANHRVDDPRRATSARRVEVSRADSVAKFSRLSVAGFTRVPPTRARTPSFPLSCVDRETCSEGFLDSLADGTAFETCWEDEKTTPPFPLFQCWDVVGREVERHDSESETHVGGVSTARLRTSTREDDGRERGKTIGRPRQHHCFRCLDYRDE